MSQPSTSRHYHQSHSKMFVLLLLGVSWWTDESSSRSFLVEATPAVSFDIETAMPAGNVLGMTLQSRITLPYGPDLYQRDPPQDDQDQPYQGYGFGMSGAEQIAYDPNHHYLYTMSDQGYVTIADYQDPSHPQLTRLSIPTPHPKVGGIEICPSQGVFLVSLEKLGQIAIYSLVNRTQPEEKPRLIKTLDAGPECKTVLPNHDCSIIAVGNTNEGEALTQGQITILFDPLTSTPTKKSISLDFDSWNDDYLLRRGLNMPLTKAAMEYWDDHSHLADEIDWALERANYRSAMFLEPENLAWNDPSETELLVNLQENNGLLRINMTDLTPVAVAGYGLRDHSRIPVDLVADGDCDLKTYPGVFAMLNPDGFSAIRYGSKTYIVTANEGGNKKYADWSEEWSSNELFTGTEFGFQNMIVPEYMFVENNTDTGYSAPFNMECGMDAGCADIFLSAGSNAIDFETDPSNPIFYRMVLNGGRGWSVFELSDDPDDLLKLVYDSGAAFDRDACAAFPWSHNSLSDDEHAPVTLANNTLWKSVQGDPDDMAVIFQYSDPSQLGCADQGDGTPGACPMKDTVDALSSSHGASIESVTVGEACGRLVAAMATEKGSLALLMDITDITSPEIVQIFHLSPASQNMSPGLAYNQGILGEIDPESTIFLSPEQSPSGKAGILWAGAQSGTVSFWEFQCQEDALPPKKAVNSSSSSSSTSMFHTLTMIVTAGAITILTSLFLAGEGIM